ncbi:UDP-N-acetylmuramoyl-tripeptide--D-alanyl-D-alanine ligase [Desulfovibrio sp. OttesenSCG-928-O18]|nr:UDP-N-acetylmuramoyl-tripeptide--D-alanyl-D-alanine ligase [Desulfovibrio sp. OttesenSCG-928-O18]
MRMNLLDICRHLGVVFVGMNPEAAMSCPTGAAIDSREVKEGNLFFCLPGNRVDGHDFAAAAVEKGALAIIGSRNPFPPGKAPVPVLVVSDPVATLGALGAAHRKNARATVIGVTGTSGKTSVKEVLAAVLGGHGETAKNPVNLNNQIGLPLSMLNAAEDADFWVMEAGISRPNDMNELGAMLQPDIALILNAGAGHVQELGDKGVAYYKARLLAHLAPHGRAVVSSDYPELAKEAGMYGVDVTYFSAEDPEADFYAAYLGPESETMGRYSLALDGNAMRVLAPFQGGYGAENVAAIGAVAHLLGLTEPEIVNGFLTAKLPAQRFAVREAGPYLLIDDSYNANPLSMARMLDAAAEMANARGQELALVLGEMGELGAESAVYHKDLARHAARLAPKAVIWKGGHGEAVGRALHEAGFAGVFSHVGDPASFLSAFLSAGMEKGVVLFKGSRVNKLEELVAAFGAMAGTDGVDKGTDHAV